MFAFASWLEQRTGHQFADYHSLWQWSVEQLPEFWEAILAYFEVQLHSPYSAVLQTNNGEVMGARWLEGATVNYAEHIFRQANEEHPAVMFAAEYQPLVSISWAELTAQVSRVAAWLRQTGLRPGDRVASYLPNTPEALVAFLATQTLGGVWSSCSPDFGTASVIDRFQQIEPRILFCPDAYHYNGKVFSREAERLALQDALPSLEAVVVVPSVGQTVAPGAYTHWQELLDRPVEPLHFEAVPFDHPMWILYSSGTTGKPKAITHSVGGILLEHLKALSLHQDVKPGERFFWYSTTGWMMWNYANSALLCGGTLVIYDGSATYPKMERLWQLAEEAGIHHMGSGAAYYIACMKAGLPLRQLASLSKLRTLGSTGSPLPPEAFRWLYEQLGPDLWLISLSGGTDVCSGFVGGSPYLPVRAGEIQCRMLGCKVEAFGESGESLIGEVGEMVITAPMPSMPVYFWNDPGQQRYRSSYFEDFPGLWRHGDWVRISPEGSLVIYGRSDATLNRGGVRIGTSEVYSAVDTVPEVFDSLVLSIEKEDGSYFMPLFVKLAPGVELDEGLVRRIQQALRTQYSPRHVPDQIIATPDIPYTISGKKMETPVKKILMGADPAKAVSHDAMRNPESLAFFVNMAARKE